MPVAVMGAVNVPSTVQGLDEGAHHRQSSEQSCNPDHHRPTAVAQRQANLPRSYRTTVPRKNAEKEVGREQSHHAGAHNIDGHSRVGKPYSEQPSTPGIDAVT